VDQNRLKPCLKKAIRSMDELKLKSQKGKDSSAEPIRGYLKATVERAWKLLNWLTHAANATGNDAEIALSATSLSSTMMHCRSQGGRWLHWRDVVAADRTRSGSNGDRFRAQ